MGVKGFRIQPERITKQKITKSNFKNLKGTSKDLKVSFCVDNNKKTYHVTTLVGNDGIYLVSNLGRIKSYQREINMGVKGFRISL